MYDWGTGPFHTQSGTKEIVLTFDDGPTDTLAPIIDTLETARVPAIFFWQGEKIRDTATLRRVVDDGHAVGSHGCHHVRLDALSREMQREDISGSMRRIEDATGRAVTLFRPPYGRFNRDTLAVTAELGLTLVLWRVAGWDWKLKNQPKTIVTNLVDHTSPGDLLLLHELPHTTHVLPEILAGLTQRGLVFGIPNWAKPSVR